MYLLDSFFLAIALAMDALAMSILLACNFRNLKIQALLAIAFSFAFFQFIMPILGYFSTCLLEDNFNISNLQEYGAWLAFILLFIIGIKMIKEAFSQEEKIEDKHISFTLIIALSISTSLDALSVGISFYLIQYPLLIPSIIIGIICFFISYIGLHIGKKLLSNTNLGTKAELFGGLVLICIGIKILIENIKH